MRKELALTLEKLPHKDGDRLPSVREIMKVYRTASSTVQAALRALEQAGKICRIQGKGCFWTSEGMSKICATDTAPAVRESAIEKIERLFREDWERGFFKIDEDLPLMKELSIRYNISQAIIRKFLTMQEARGILERCGRHYRFTRKDEARPTEALCEIIFVTRCNSWGGFTAESEREMDFLRMVYKKAGAEHYKLILLGLNETTGLLIDRSGKPRNLADFRNAVGAVLSTLLVMEPIKLLQLFASVRYPVAVWWEHPLQALPERYLHKENWTFFNSTFGPGPGKEMGKYLLSRGVHDVAFFSPYHDSSWSVERLEGLREIGLSVMECTDDEFASPWDYKQIARKKVEKHSVEAYARELLKQKMVDILKKCDYEQIPIVCVNDDVASALLELHEEGCIGPLGQIYAFDNSAESYLLRLPSYDFNTQALVDRMFYSLVNRDAFRMQHRIQQVLGQVIEK